MQRDKVFVRKRLIQQRTDKDRVYICKRKISLRRMKEWKEWQITKKREKNEWDYRDIEREGWGQSVIDWELIER